LVPLLLRDFRERRPDVAVQLLEEKTTLLLPRRKRRGGSTRHFVGPFLVLVDQSG
jgi:hypothetical protein